MELGNRFIPSSNSSSAYRNSDGESSRTVSPVQNDAANISIRDDSFFSFNNSYIANELISPSNDSSASNSPKSNNLSPSNSFQESIADALGFNSNGKVFQFEPSPKSKSPPRNKSKSKSNGPGQQQQPNTPSKNEMKLIAHAKPKFKRSSKVKLSKVTVATDILQAPGLRNDFYSNLVSWSKKTNKIAVGLGVNSYLWGIDNHVEQIHLDALSLVTAVSCSRDDYIVIANSRGMISLIEQPKNIVLAVYTLQNKCVFCFEWFSKSNRFIAGNEVGEVHIFEIVYGQTRYELVEVACFKSHQQQICGLALSMDNTRLAVGANDNSCSLWDIKNLETISLMFVLPHNAAVKAIAFCPWTNSLLATGGGSKDRKIRFWHTSSGTKLNEIPTHGQVTSLIWSRYKKEIAATFGFGADSTSSLLCVYSYPSMKPLVEVPSVPNLRILSSSSSPDWSSVCVAANDSTVRIYKLWEKTHDIGITMELKGSGTYGSSLIEYQEGIGSINDSVR
ncbi:WD40-repeat-containing domain protein [Scheffersomyces coipomensis]|uniref:WD40-repeat-containing domain protein n=1 Tax=Scheffersomyces coipomensis TaxID=1788519 RepID=UPI00315CEDEE